MAEKEESNKKIKSIASPGIGLSVGTIIIIVIVILALAVGGYLIFNYLQNQNTGSEDINLKNTGSSNNPDNTGYADSAQKSISGTQPNNSSNSNTNTTDGTGATQTSATDQNVTTEEDEDEDSGSGGGGGGGGGGGTNPPTPIDPCDNLGAVVFNLDSQDFNKPITIILSYVKPGCDFDIRYTLNGQNPDLSNSSIYNTATGITLSQTTTVKAAVVANNVWGPITEKIYTYDYSSDTALDSECLDLGTVNFNPKELIHSEPIKVILSYDNPKCLYVIRYTIDGFIPTVENSRIYDNPITLNSGSTKISAAIFSTNPVGIGPTKTMVYVINLQVAKPTASPSGGTYTLSQSVTLSTQTTGATIRYTTNGTAPNCTTNGTIYSEPINISTSTTLKAIGCKDGYISSEIMTENYIINLDQVATPTASPAGGTYNNDFTITLSSLTSGATIKYLLGGTIPTCNSGNAYSGPIPITSSTTLKAIACKDGLLDSSILNNTYTLAIGGNPYASVNTETYYNDFYVTLTKQTITTGTTLTYTTNNTTPTANSTIYTAPILINTTTTLRFAEFKTGYTPSEVIAKGYTLKVATPAASPAGGAYTSTQNIALSTTTTGATIRYTTNGTTPTCSTGTTYSAPITISSSTTLKAIGCKTNYVDSDVLTATYTINLSQVATPTISPDAGTSNYGRSITIASTTTGATIRYTLDGSEPTTTSQQYSGPITLNQTSQVIIKAKAFKDGWNPSLTATKTYPILTVTTPSASPPGGTYTSSQNVALSTTTSGATIKYTTDGATPTCSTGTTYSSAINISTSTTLKAIGCKTDYVPSNIMTQTYTINTQQSSWVWAKKIGGSNLDATNQVVVDSSGNSYITGYFNNNITVGSFNLTNRGQHDVFVVKYDPNGNVLWANSAGGTSTVQGQGVDIGTSLAVDNSGNVFVVGRFTSPTMYFGSTNNISINRTSSANDIFVAKLNNSGTWLWAKKAGGTSTDEAVDVVVDSSSNLYIVGTYRNGATFPPLTNPFTSLGYADIFVTKLDSTGNFLWVTTAGGTSYEGVTAIALDSSNNIYITGSFVSEIMNFGSIVLNKTSSVSSDAFVAKLNNSGSWVWVTQVIGSGSHAASDIIIDNSNNLYITGDLEGTADFDQTTLTSSGYQDIFVAKLNSSGSWLWASKAGGSNTDQGVGIAIDSQSNVYVTGRFEGTPTFGQTTLTNSGLYDVFLAKLNASNGSWLSAEKIGGTGNDLAYRIAIGPNNSIYCVGYFENTVSFGSNNLTSAGISDGYIAKRG